MTSILAGHRAQGQPKYMPVDNAVAPLQKARSLEAEAPGTKKAITHDTTLLTSPTLIYLATHAGASGTELPASILTLLRIGPGQC